VADIRGITLHSHIPTRFNLLQGDAFPGDDRIVCGLLLLSSEYQKANRGRLQTAAASVARRRSQHGNIQRGAGELYIDVECMYVAPNINGPEPRGFRSFVVRQPIITNGCQRHSK